MIPEITTDMKSVSVASSAEIGMGADGADLGEAGEVKPLSCHGYQRSGLMDAEVGAEFDGTGKERAWLGQLGQRQHLRYVRFGQFAEDMVRAEQEAGPRRSSDTFLR